MRLTENERIQIVAGIAPFVAQTSCSLWLFGSRTDDSLRGGDIDLALIVDTLDEFERLSRDSYKLVAGIKMELDSDERIDLLVTTPDRMASDPFQKMALKQAIELFSWNVLSPGYY